MPALSLDSCAPDVAPLGQDGACPAGAPKPAPSPPGLLPGGLSFQGCLLAGPAPTAGVVRGPKGVCPAMPA